MNRAAALGLLAAGCGSVTPPERADAYNYNIGPGFQFVFHWTPASLPVRVWAEQSLRTHVAAAITIWESISLYGEFRGVLIDDSSRADVIFRRGEPEQLPTHECRGVTPWAVLALDTTMILPFRSTLHPRAGAQPNDVERCFSIVAAHELGHSLGLIPHSDDEADLMNVRPTVAGPSRRDRTSFARLYHTYANVGIPASR